MATLTRAALKDSPLGQLVPIEDNELAFVPNPLPRQLAFSTELVYTLDEASRAVSQLAGVGETLPNPYLLIRPFAHREAVLSSRIEGTQASISDVYIYEASDERVETGDVREVANYVGALELGLTRLRDLPVSVRLMNEVHSRLLSGVRGQDKRPGELRAKQVWIGDRDTPIPLSTYIPPPPSRVRDLLTDWESFVNEDPRMPPLVQCALMHYQFEAIHPYLDGNGRIGRLLIPLFLCAKAVLPTPLLYLSAYFERGRGDEYRDQLLRLSITGDWEAWLRYFLVGVAEQSRDALIRSRKTRDLQERYRSALQQDGASGNVLRLLDELFINPFMTVPRARRILGLTYAGARGALERLERENIVEFQRHVWPRLYIARELVKVIEAPVAKSSE